MRLTQMLHTTPFSEIAQWFCYNHPKDSLPAGGRRTEQAAPSLAGSLQVDIKRHT
jgi:hypothetical protein